VRAYSYDAAGNSLTTGATTHTYYNNGRMKTAKLGAASATTYTYNALGQRVKKNGPGGGFYYVYDEAGHLQGEYTSGGGTLEETVWLGDIPIATVRPNGSGGSIVYYVHTDQLNTPRKVTNSNTASLAVRWTWDPPPFGDDLPKESPTGLTALSYNLRFPGQLFDAESGLNYNYFRDYDPAIGRYVQSDPIGLAGGINTYAYVRGNPLALSDPEGLAAAAGAMPAPSIPGTGGPSIVDGVVAAARTPISTIATAGAGTVAAASAAVAGAGYLGWQFGSWLYPNIAIPLGDAIDKLCKTKEQNCRALYDTIIRSCWSIQNPRKRQRCFEAAKSTYEQCMAQD